MNALPQAEWWRPEPAAGPESRGEAASAGSPEARSGRYAFRALLVLTFILVLSPQSFVRALQPLRIALLAAAAGIGAHVLDRVTRGRPLTVRGREMGLAAALVAWSVITVPASLWPGGSVAFLLNVYLKTLAIFWLLANTVDSVGRLRTLAWALTAMAVPLALTAVKNFVTGDFLGANRIVGYEAGLTANPNDLALMLNLLLPLTVALLMASRNGVVRLVLAGIVVMVACGVIVTFSRAGFLSLAASAALYLWRLVRRGSIGWVLAALLAGLIGAALLPGSYLSRLATITDIDRDTTGSAQARWEDTQAAVKFVAANPLIGAGIGMDTEALNGVRGATWKQMHNIWLEYAVDLGLPGLALFVALFVSCVRRVRRIQAEPVGEGPAGRQLSCLAEGIEISLLGFGIGAFFAPVAYLFYFYFLAGLAVAAGGVHAALAAAPSEQRERAS
jgi:O-antigen ligase